MSYKVLLTSVGGELAPYVINHLKNKTRHEIYLVGVDMSKFALGKDFCDKFYEVPPGNNKNYAEKIKEIVLSEKIDLVIPASDEEALSLSYSKDEFSKISCNIASINYKDLEVLSDKYKTYNLLAKNNIHVPFYLLASSKNELIQAIDRIKIRDSKFNILNSIFWIFSLTLSSSVCKFCELQPESIHRNCTQIVKRTENLIISYSLSNIYQSG